MSVNLKQGDHIFEKLNSLSFPWVFQDILDFSPEQLKREKFDECIFVGNHVTYFSFPLSFPLDFDNFSNSLSFPGLPCFPGLWPPCKKLVKYIRFWIFLKYPFSDISLTDD